MSDLNQFGIYPNIGTYLAELLQTIGLEHYFTVPGDYNLVLLDQILKNPNLQMINCCNELNAGYARSRGVSAVVITFTVGGFPSSNPTSHSECTAEEAYKWSDGRAVFASGSPFPPVKYGNQTFVPGQGNNVYIFPAMGMAVYVTQAKRVTDEMFITAAKALAEQVSPSDLAMGLVYPPQSEILKTPLHIAEKVAEVIFALNLAGVQKPSNLKAFIESQAYTPEYKSLI